MTTNQKRLVPISQVADYYGVSQQTIRKWEEQGKIKSFRMNKNSHRRYDLEDIIKKVNK